LINQKGFKGANLSDNIVRGNVGLGSYAMIEMVQPQVWISINDWL